MKPKVSTPKTPLMQAADKIRRKLIKYGMPQVKLQVPTDCDHLPLEFIDGNEFPNIPCIILRIEGFTWSHDVWYNVIGPNSVVRVGVLRAWRNNPKPVVDGYASPFSTHIIPTHLSLAERAWKGINVECRAAMFSEVYLSQDQIVMIGSEGGPYLITHRVVYYATRLEGFSNLFWNAGHFYFPESPLTLRPAGRALTMPTVQQAIANGQSCACDCKDQVFLDTGCHTKPKLSPGSCH